MTPVPWFSTTECRVFTGSTVEQCMVLVVFHNYLSRFDPCLNSYHLLRVVLIQIMKLSKSTWHLIAGVILVGAGMGQLQSLANRVFHQDIQQECLDGTRNRTFCIKQGFKVS